MCPAWSRWQALKANFHMYLIHTPFYAKSEADFHRAWKAMEEVKKAGLAKSIGVSNYLRADVEATLRGTSDPPVINQIEYHAYLQRANDYVPWLQEQNIQVGSFKGLTPAIRCPDGPLKEPLARIAAAHATTEAVILLAWVMHSGIVAVTTTSKPERLDEYANALKVKLTEAEFKEISDVGGEYHHRSTWTQRFDKSDRS